MKPEKCPTCGGYCCEDYARRWRPSLRYGHGWPNEHACPDCSDGHAPMPKPLKPPSATAEDERAAVVAYLRELGAINAMLSPCLGVADDIERGAHRREEKG